MTYQTITSLRRHLFSIKLCLQKCLGHYDIMDNSLQECLISQNTYILLDDIRHIVNLMKWIINIRRILFMKCDIVCEITVFQIKQGNTWVIFTLFKLDTLKCSKNYITSLKENDFNVLAKKNKIRCNHISYLYFTCIHGVYVVFLAYLEKCWQFTLDLAFLDSSEGAHFTVDYLIKLQNCYNNISCNFIF